MTLLFKKTLMASAMSAVLTVVLSACAPVNTRPDSNSSTERPAAVSVDAGADWAWTVTGDNAVRPLQVFSLDGKTYLQMHVGQLIPAVVVDGQPVSFTIAAPYIVLQGEPQEINLLAHGYRSVILHQGPVKSPPSIAPNRVQRIAVDGDSPTMGSDVDASKMRSVFRTPTVDIAHVAAVAPPRAQRVWRIEPGQRLLSEALTDWSHEAGVHLVWKSRVDVPITGYAEYRDGSFLGAMTHALADASGGGYRFFFSMNNDKTITVVAVRAS